ncbi:hypothetical protein FA95DRAFT_1609496 [Auriscalpium vulgare]|uniref:Uncharacterized protein n=1 Tax=Auriscalpium vulgare TaxID=40419 RepID=A0ACB8RHV1_9AGAM|nr:hypothetical protein FA95DRAFT_1609496 [Auriscalpium vulgare]
MLSDAWLAIAATFGFGYASTFGDKMAYTRAPTVSSATGVRWIATQISFILTRECGVLGVHLLRDRKQ